MRAAQGNWRGAHRASRRWTDAWAISNKQTDATWAANTRERNQGTARGPLLPDKLGTGFIGFNFQTACGALAVRLAIHRSGILGGMQLCAEYNVLLCSAIQNTYVLSTHPGVGSRLRCCWRSKPERELETGFVLFQMRGAGSSQQAAASLRNTKHMHARPAERNRPSAPSKVKLHQPHAMAAGCTGRNPPPLPWSRAWSD